MTTQLRPMTTGEILDRTFNLYRNNFMLFAGIAVVPPACMLVVQLIQATLITTPGHTRTANLGLAAAGGFGILVGAIAYMVGLAVAHAATVFAVSAVHLGRNTSIGESYGKVKGRYGRVVWVIFQVALRSFALPALLFILAAVAMPLMVPTAGKTVAGLLVAVIFLAALVLAIVGFVLYLRYSLAVAACVLEDIKASAAIKRSVFLSKGSRGQIFVIYFLMTLISLIVAWAFAIPAGLLAAAVAKGSPATALFFTALASFLAGTLAGPIATIALSLVYYDQRVRKEAFDIQLMIAAVDGTPALGTQAASAG